MDPLPPPDAPLQFEQADFAAAQPAGAVCMVAAHPIKDTYFELNGRLLCPACREDLERQLGSGSPWRRVGKAVGLGLLAAIAGSVGWYLIRRATGYEIGLIAIAVGFLVGKAVRMGSENRGGRGYQLLAVFLTYSAVAFANGPDILGYARGSHLGQQVTTTRSSVPAAAAPEAAPSDPSTPAAPADEKPVAAPLRADPPPSLLGFLFAVVLLAGITFISPFLGLPGNIIGLFILFFGLSEAWKMNRGLSLAVSGPFRLASRPPAAAAVAAVG